MKKKIIVYGCGEIFRKQKIFLEAEYDCIGYSDKCIEKIDLGGDNAKKVYPKDISESGYDYVYICSTKYMDEIREELNREYHIPTEKILTMENMWWYVPNLLPRKRWIIEKLKKLPGGGLLLDAGAGNRKYEPFCSHLTYISQDFGEYDDSPKDIGIQGGEEWKSRECDILSDIINIPMSDKSCDAILCSEVFEHIKNPILALKEFHRLLKDGGILILTAPFCSLTHMAPYYYANGFSKYWFMDNLKDAGFEILEYKTYGNWFNYIVKELERLPYMAERYGVPLKGEFPECVIETMRILMEQSVENKGSEEVLCLDSLVYAKKR